MPVVATLEDGTEFEIDLRIVAPRSATTGVGLPPAEAAEGSSREERLEPDRAVIEEPPPRPSAQPSATQQQEVARHVARARQLAQEDRWQEAQAELMAAHVATAGNDDLRRLVRRERLGVVDTMMRRLGETLTQAAAALRQEQYPRARQLLREARAPSEDNRAIQRLDDLAAMLEMLHGAGGLTEAQLTRLATLLTDAWESARQGDAYGVLPELAGLAASWHVDDLAEAIIRTVASSGREGVPAETCRALQVSLKQMNQAGVVALLDHLGREDYDATSGPWLVSLLSASASARGSATLVQAYKALPPGGRDRLVKWLCRLAGQSVDALLVLLAGVLQRVPPDPRVAQAVRAQLGLDRLEKAAIQWAASGHGPAQIVLKNLYDYPESAFSSR